MSAAALHSPIAAINKKNTQDPLNWLLQLPEAALHQLLQKLDPGTLACTAVTCSQLNDAVLADISKVNVQCSQPDTFSSLSTWLERHRTSLMSLRQCSIAGKLQAIGGHRSYVTGGFPPHLCSSLCPQLRQLHLKDVVVEFQPAGGGPGVLHDCTGLTALDLERCVILDVPAAAATVAALSELRQLRLTVKDADESLLAALPDLPLQLTHLKVKADLLESQEAARLLQQLSSLVSLEHLELGCLPPAEVPDGFLSQLSKLTCLNITFDEGDNVAEKFQHLSSLTALQQLTVHSYGQTAGDFSVIERLSQLTSLDVRNTCWHHHAASTHIWIPKAGFLTALQNVSLRGCRLQLTALSTCTQLRMLELDPVQDWRGASLQDLLGVVPQLSQLTGLSLDANGLKHTVPSSAAAFTALTFSANLCYLFIGNMGDNALQDCVFFKPGTVYPRLRWYGLWHQNHAVESHIQQLSQVEQLVSCCPALERMVYNVCSGFMPTALLPLQQLSALTTLWVKKVGAATAAVASGVAQLTALKHLVLEDMMCEDYGPAQPALLQLTALTRLRWLELYGLSRWDEPVGLVLRDTARWGKPPDVWKQLLERLPQTPT